LTHARG